MFVLFYFPALFCVYLWGKGPVNVQPTRLLTLYGVPVGPIANCLGTVALNASALICIPIRMSLIFFWKFSCGGENSLCRYHSTFQFEFLTSKIPPLLLPTHRFWSQDSCCTKLICRSWHLLFKLSVHQEVKLVVGLWLWVVELEVHRCKQPWSASNLL